MSTRHLLNFVFWTVILLLCLYCVGKMESAAVVASEPEPHKRLFPGGFPKVFYIPDGPPDQNTGINFHNTPYRLYITDFLSEFEEEKQVGDYLQSAQKQDDNGRGHSFIHFGKRRNGVVNKERNKVLFQQGLQSENSLYEHFEALSHTEDKRYENERILHLRKRFIGKSKNKAYSKQPNLRKLKSNKELRGHATMSFDKRVHSIKHPGHYIIHFGKRDDNSNLRHYQMMDFESVVEEEKQHNRHIMCLKKQLEKEQRSDEQMMPFGKRMKERAHWPKHNVLS
ncbi:uncharacterized protein LOC143258129 [Tachypleus tridentatus]|uniref:uncharacterized protein LOC143258129 n=1 Tax=Tachypleus tridentatus TaxID=6853 RepID=UPI003FD02D7F